jgi:hypothetical protein
VHLSEKWQEEGNINSTSQANCYDGENRKIHSIHISQSNHRKQVEQKEWAVNLQSRK